tara:strand:+ start:273 stop:596 length:324 start_codon:yes stop_codon:yes gene_type:complete
MAAPIIGLVGLAARAIGKKFAKKYAKGSGKRPVSGLSAETKAKNKALNESLRETNRGLRELNKDMQESIKKQKIRQDAATEEAMKIGKKMLDAGSKGAYHRGPGTKQ